MSQAVNFFAQLEKGGSKAKVPLYLFSLHNIAPHASNRSSPIEKKSRDALRGVSSHQRKTALLLWLHVQFSSHIIQPLPTQWLATRTTVTRPRPSPCLITSTILMTSSTRRPRRPSSVSARVSSWRRSKTPCQNATSVPLVSSAAAPPSLDLPVCIALARAGQLDDGTDPTKNRGRKTLVPIEATPDQNMRNEIRANFCRAAASPAAYTFFSRTAMNLREKDDALAAGIGGFAAGAVLGLPSELLHDPMWDAIEGQS